MKKPYEVHLDLKANHIRPTDILYTSGDAETMPLRIWLESDYAPVAPDPGAMAALNFVLPGDIRYPRKVPLDPDGSLLYEVQPGDISVPGTVAVSVTAVYGSERLTWQGFAFEAVGSLADGQTEPPDVYKDWFQQIMEDMAELKKRLDDIEAGGDAPEPPETRFFLGAPPAEPGVRYIITAGGIIDANKVVLN